jgi:hypothetical protein
VTGEIIYQTEAGFIIIIDTINNEIIIKQKGVQTIFALLDRAEAGIKALIGYGQALLSQRELDSLPE